MYFQKYHESDGIRVYTPVRSYSRERKAEYSMRRWQNVNGESNTT